MNVLFIGGTGNISSACSQLALEAGFDLTLLNRGQSIRPTPQGVRLLHADVRDVDAVRRTLRGLRFDVVVDWIAFTPDQAQRDLDLFRGRVNQYIFISSASAYQKPLAQLPIVESTPLYNPFWQYSRDKIACEDLLVQAYRTEGFPITIVRPSYTYDRMTIPLHGGYTVIDRMRRGLPVIVHGDGTSIWVMTHHLDFARGFTGLLGNPHALGEAFHITSDELLTWNEMYLTMARAAGVADPHLVHIPSEVIAHFDPVWGDGLLGDKAHSVIFDNSKIKRTVPTFKAVIPFAQGAREIMGWYDADPARRVVDPEFNLLTERLLDAFQSVTKNISPGEQIGA